MELTMQQAITKFLRKYKHFILILYLPLYMIWFAWLEHREAVQYTIIHCKLDDWIPFLEIFAIPYFLWFVYVVAVLCILFTQTGHLGDFYRCAATLMLGMTTCLLIYTIFPNAQQLRPRTFPRDNALVRLIAALYRGDTPTNVCPSIHVYNSIAIHTAVIKSHFFQNKKGLKKASLILCILICLSTMFLKQHSAVDVICAILLFALYYRLVYKTSRRV
jgi:membrane-associated phospholipid phosphatase